jgi:UDP-N-acetyl-D-glucosamine dehydrogenase
MQVLRSRGAVLSYHDPYVPELPEFGLESADLATLLPDADAIVLVTAHPDHDHRSIAEQAALMVDLRGVTRGLSREALIRL